MTVRQAASSQVDSESASVRIDVRSEAEALGCPKCHAPFQVEPALAVCSACGARYPIDDGMLCTDRTNVFMGEFDAARMRDFARMAREQGWRRTVKESMAREHPGAQAILLNPERANFLDLLPLERRGTVLDLGAGMGAVSLRLAESFDRVYALDQTFERLAFLQVIADQEGARAIRTVCHRDVFKLPFRSGSLDAIAMIGVFEYFAASYPDLDIAEVQRRALGELHRVLAPGGVLFVATKNRLGWPYWAGAKDNSGVRFGGLMPRALANAASRWMLRRPLRIVTDSYGRYRSMLLDAGFRDPRFYWPIVGYQAPRAWIDLGDRQAIARAVSAYPSGALKRRLIGALTSIGLLKYAVPHFGIVATKAAAR